VTGKKVLRYAVMLPGILYLWALLPVSVRPQYTGSPFRKPDATLNIDIGAARAAGVSSAAVATVGETGLQTLSKHRIKQACEPPALLTPIVRPAQRLVVRYIDNGKVVSEKVYDCSNYV
jgi:hypothetical protein